MPWCCKFQSPDCGPTQEIIQCCQTWEKIRCGWSIWIGCVAIKKSPTFFCGDHWSALSFLLLLPAWKRVNQIEVRRWSKLQSCSPFIFILMAIMIILIVILIVIMSNQTLHPSALRSDGEQRPAVAHTFRLTFGAFFLLVLHNLVWACRLFPRLAFFEMLQRMACFQTVHLSSNMSNNAIWMIISSSLIIRQ